MADISKRTVAILLVIAIVVSVIGTWTAMTGNVSVIKSDSSASGNAVIKVLGEKSAQSGSAVSGNAVITVKKSK